jgi:LuxR family maltose regulon positive regulatory protein
MPRLLGLARVLIAQREYQGALALLSRLIETEDARGWTGRVIEPLALQAVALHAQGEASAALVALERALVLAEPEGYIRTFVDEGQQMAALLREALARGIAPAYVEHLLAAFRPPDTEIQGDGAAGSVPSHRLTASMLTEPVTARELEVLRLLAAGASNAEMARDLVVEQSTIKTHLINLYGKLGVHSRTQAVARARALHLLD